MLLELVQITASQSLSSQVRGTFHVTGTPSTTPCHEISRLALFLRERGANVVGFGRASTAESFRVACTVFVPIPDASVGKTGKPKAEPKRQPSLPELLAGAIAKNADKQGWARVQAVANHMRQHHGQAAKDHGKATWSKVLMGLPGYEFRDEGTTSVAVRLKLGG